MPRTPHTQHVAVKSDTSIVQEYSQLRKELQDTQIAKTMQQNAALTWLDGAPATMAKHC
jgi:hypothetical protein